MKEIRVAFVINDFSGAGAQKLVADIFAHIDRTRFKPSLITLFEPKEGSTMYHLLSSDIETVRLDFKGASDVRSWMKLYRTFGRLKPDVVVSHLFFSNTVVRVLKPLIGYKAIATEHNTYTNKSRFHQFIDRVLAVSSFAIIAVSTTVKEFTSEQENIPLKKFHVILNGTDTSTIADAVGEVDPSKVREELRLPGARLIINVARLSEQKNHSLLLKGFAQFAARHTDTHLIILGEGEKREALEAEMRSLGIEKQVHFLGYRDNVYRYHAVSDFFVSTSTIEGLSIAYIEALAAGVPILSTRTSGTDEMIEEGVNGFFIPERTPESVAESLERMITSDLASMKAGARKSAQRFDIKTTTRAYEDLIAEAAAG